MSTHEIEFMLSDGERIVRDYECTEQRRLFGPATIGYLAVTNKRIVYHSRGKSATGFSSVLSEMPLEDVAGFSASVGNSLNWLVYLVVIVGLFVVTWLVTNILPIFLTGWVVAILLLVPYAITFLFDKNILSTELREQAVRRLKDMPLGIGPQQVGKTNYRGIFRVLASSGLVLIAWNIAFRTRLGYEAPMLGYLLLLGAYILACANLLGRLRTFSLLIGSKTSKGSGIYIPGSALGALLGDKAAAQSLSGGPARDAETLVHELGALLTDIRQLGDLGIYKWAK